MIEVNDLVRVFDGGQVIEGRVTGLFGIGDTDYVEIGTKVYTTDEVTKVPNQQTSEESQEKAYQPAIEDYVAELDDRPDDVKALVNVHEDAELNAAIDKVIELLLGYKTDGGDFNA